MTNTHMLLSKQMLLDKYFEHFELDGHEDAYARMEDLHQFQIDAEGNEHFFHLLFITDSLPHVTKA